MNRNNTFTHPFIHLYLFQFFLVVSLSHLYGIEQIEKAPIHSPHIQRMEILQDASSLMRSIAPEWRPSCIERWKNGAIRILEFIDPVSDWPLKRIEYYETENQIYKETDLFAPTIGRINDDSLRGVRDGIEILYYRDGAPLSCTTYSRGKKHGIEKCFYEKGSILSLSQYVDGKEVGESLHFWPENGHGYSEIAERKQFENGLLHGNSFQFSKSGEKMVEAPYRNGLLHGMRIRKDIVKGHEENSHWLYGLLSDCGKSPALTIYDMKTLQVIKKAHYCMGVPHGLNISWHQNGQVKSKCSYMYGKKEGEEIEYDVQGICIKKLVHHNELFQGFNRSKDEEGEFEKISSRDGMISHHTISSIKGTKRILRESYTTRKNRYQELNGEYLSFYPDSGKLFQKLHFKNGNLDGVQERFYESGVKAFSFQFLNGVRHGLQKEWDEYGNELIVSKFSSGSRSGLYREFSDAKDDKVLLYEASFTNDELNGESIQYDTHGRKIEHSFWKEGKEDGLFERWSLETGNLIYQAHFIEGVPHGTWNEWHANGVLKKRCQFIDGYAEGVSSEWYINGVKSQEERYKHGVLSGLKQKWYENGSLSFEGLYQEEKPIGRHITFYPFEMKVFIEEHFDENGYYHGIQRSYYPDGKLQATSSYLHGVLDGKKEKFRENGEKRLSLSYSKGLLEGSYIHLLGNNMLEERSYKNGLPHGLWRVFMQSEECGKKVLYAEAEYIQGLISGCYKEFYPNGKLMLQVPFQNGFRDGKAIIYNSDGMISISTEYQEGKQEGEMLIYYPSGILLKRSHFHNSHLSGSEISYHKNGREKIRAQYIEGYLDGPIYEWSDQGVLLYEGFYRKGKRDGVFRKYRENGILKAEIVYELDRIVKK